MTLTSFLAVLILGLAFAWVVRSYRKQNADLNRSRYFTEQSERWVKTYEVVDRGFRYIEWQIVVAASFYAYDKTQSFIVGLISVSLFMNSSLVTSFALMFALSHFMEGFQDSGFPQSTWRNAIVGLVALIAGFGGSYAIDVGLANAAYQIEQSKSSESK